MSEAMSSVEIEDVLSSIRRLVSEDLRPGNRPATKKPDEKLILTSAFRVVAEVTPSIAPAPPKSPSPRLHLGAPPVIEDLAAKLERAVEAQDVEWESETGDPQPIVAQMEWTETGWAPVVSAPQPAAAHQPDPVPSWAQTDLEDLGGALEEAPLIQTTVEPDAHWADMAEAEAMAELRDEIAEDAPFAADVRPDITFDEQVLRDLVRDLIREELQGGLGERITRNVRKLVHAEIARALAAQDFE